MCCLAHPCDGLNLLMNSLPWARIGSTSFLLHAPYVPAVRYTAERSRDVSLLLNATGSQNEWLISREEVAELSRVLDETGASLHVHLPADGIFATKKQAEAMVSRMVAAVRRTQPLHPHTFVAHIACPDIRHCQKKLLDVAPWIPEVLQPLLEELPDPAMLAIENLEDYAPDIWDALVERLGCSFCADIGHLWRDGQDPVLFLRERGPRIRICHLHGVQSLSPGQRQDHRGLDCVPEKELIRILRGIRTYVPESILVIEVFDVGHFEASCTALCLAGRMMEQAHG